MLSRDRQPADSKKTNDPIAALQWIIEREQKQCSTSLYVFKDLHPFISPRTGRSTVIRKIRDTIRALEPTKSAIVVLSPSITLPEELEKEAVIVDFELPGFDHIHEALHKFVEQWSGNPRIQIQLSEEDKYALAKAACGLTLAEAELAFAKALVADLKLDRSDEKFIIDDKKQIIRKTGILSVEEPTPFEDVGGLENLKAWLQKRKDIFTERARKFGIPDPKGVMLTGIPGCGKSLCAKAMASFWGMPLLRLDMGAIFQGLVGSSEANIRKAIACAEAMSPCILMIDEIEKGLAGVSGSQGDGGTSTRVFGTLLTWMNDKNSPVFVVATANEFDRLPPELLRKGRFDEIFFVDFPNAAERRTIFEIHIRKRQRDPQNFDLPRLVRVSENFTGSEIEQAVISAMIEAFSAGLDDFTTDELIRGLETTIPLIDIMRDKIVSIRERSRDFTVSASKPDTERTLSNSAPSAPDASAASPASGGRQLDL